MQLRHVIGLTLLIGAVPLQMYLMRYNQNFRDLVSEVVKRLPVAMQELTVDLAGYAGVARNYLKSIYEYFNITSITQDTQSSKDEELPEHMIHNFRPPHLEYKIGDVVLTKNMILGAIVGWVIDKADLTKEPEYILLTHEDELTIETQNHLIVIENIQIHSKNISKYFESYDGIKYIPLEYLKKLYPKG